MKQVEHNLYRQKKDPPAIPDWMQKEKEDDPSKKIKVLEKRIREIEYMLFPESSNVITIPRGVDPEKIEEEYKLLKAEYKKLLKEI